MQTQRINITLPSDLIRDMRTSIPPRGRSKFIAGAVKKELEKKRNLKKDLIKSLKANRKLYEKVMKEWDSTVADGLSKW